MFVNPYIGHSSQLCGVEEVRLVGGKGDGMRLLQVRNAAGLEFTVSADRCADISRLIFKGNNMGYMTAAGYVAPAYYDREGLGFLKSFTAGFFTTCGLTAVGSPCEDDGETLGLHGTISNTPCAHIWWDENEDTISIHALVDDSTIFSHKLTLRRTITVGKFDNTIRLTDTVTNEGDTESPLMLLYHMNMGYPLLSEHSVLRIPSEAVTGRTENATADIAHWSKMQQPTAGYVEECFYHKFTKNGSAAIENPDIKAGLEITFDPENLPFFTEWKMMGVRDYVLGLEPGNCTPDGRDAVRAKGDLQMISPGESVTFRLKVRLYEMP